MSAGNLADPEIVQTLYSHHHSWLQGWLRRKLGCAAQAADLAQDTFVQVLLSRHLHAIEEPRAYLTTIAKRTLFDFWRRRDLEQAYMEALAALPEAFAPSSEERYAVLQALEIIDQALDQLPHKVRQVFLLNQLQELSYREIAEQLDMPVITVRRYMARGIRACCEVQLGRELPA